MAEYMTTKSIEELREILPRLAEATTLAIDLETSGFNWIEDDVVGIAVSPYPEQAFYIPLQHPDISLDRLEATRLLRPVFEHPDKTYTFHNAKFDMRFLREFGIDVPANRVEDTLLQVFCAGEYHTSLGLKQLSASLFGYNMVKFEDLFPRGTKDKNAGRLLAELVGLYACEDADYTHRIHQRYYDKVRASVIYGLERKLWSVVSSIEETGFAVRAEFWEETVLKLQNAMSEIEAAIVSEIEGKVGHSVSINLLSPKQLGEVLFDVLGLPVLSKTPSGQPSTSEKAMNLLSRQGYAIVDSILTYRSINTTIKSMSMTLPSQVWDDGRIHTSYNQAGASTGRFGSSAPNIQNIGKIRQWDYVKADGSKEVLEVNPRHAFIPDAGHYLVEFDFGQIEFVCMAWLSGERSLVQAYEDGLDIHSMTASLMYGISYEDVSKKQRTLAKMINYLVIYGGSAYGLAQRSDLTEEEAEQGMRRLFQRCPRFADYMRQVRDSSRASKSVSSFFGRKQVIPEFYERNPRARSKADRVGVNRIMQGTAADIQKFGLVRTHLAVEEALQSGSVNGFVNANQVRNVAQTHDSQTWTICQSIRPQDIIPLISDAMSPNFPEMGIDFPRILVDAELGLNWGELTAYDAGLEYTWNDAGAPVKRVEVNQSSLLKVDLSGVPSAQLHRAIVDLNSLVDVFAVQDDGWDVEVYVNPEHTMNFKSALSPDDFRTAFRSRCPEARMSVR